jgi:hypothetical protein
MIKNAHTHTLKSFIVDLTPSQYNGEDYKTCDQQINIYLFVCVLSSVLHALLWI